MDVNEDDEEKMKYNRGRRQRWISQKGKQLADISAIMSNSVLAILDDFQYFGAEDKYLNLHNRREHNRDIRDGMMNELCERIEKCGDKIAVLDLSNNKITSKGASLLLRRIKKNPYIERLYLSENRLCDKVIKSLVIFLKHNKKLKCILLGDEEGSVSSKISDRGLKLLSSSLTKNTALRYLNFYGCKNITDVSISYVEEILKNTRIEDINLTDTSMTVNCPCLMLQVRNCLMNKSEELDLSNKKVNLNDTLAICELLKEYTDDLMTVKFYFCAFDTKSAIAWFDALKYQKKLKKILASYNQFGDEAVDYLIDLLKQNTTIEKIDIENCKLTEKGIIPLIEVLHGNTTIRRLKIGGNTFQVSPIMHQFTHLVKTTHIQSLDIGYNYNIEGKSLTTALLMNQLNFGGHKIYLNEKGIDDSEMNSICEILEAKGLSSINDIRSRLKNNKIGSEACKRFFTLLSVEKKIKRLDLTLNRLDEGCADSLCDFLSNNNELEVINLGNNRISDNLVERICSALIGNTKIRSLLLSGNKGITSKSFKPLKIMIEKSTVTDFYLFYTSMDHDLTDKLDLISRTSYRDRDIPIFSSSKSAAKATWN